MICKQHPPHPSPGSHSTSASLAHPPCLSDPWEFQMGQILSKSAPLLNKEDLKHFYWLRISNLFLSPFFETTPEKQTLWVPSSGLSGEFSNISKYGSIGCLYIAASHDPIYYSQLLKKQTELVKKFNPARRNVMKSCCRLKMLKYLSFTSFVNL